VKTTPNSLKFALGNLIYDKDCLLVSKVSGADKGSKLDLPLIVLSTPYSIGQNTTSYATDFLLWINHFSFFHQFRVSHPNAGRRKSCDPNFTTVSWPCKGTTNTCTFPRNLRVGKPKENECCWRYNFRYYLEKSKKSRGFMVQLTGWDEDMDKHSLGRGQQIETEMAKQVGIKIFRVVEKQTMVDTGELQLDRRYIGDLQKNIKVWLCGDRKDLSIVQVTLPKIDTDASLLLHEVVNESILSCEEDLVIETLNKIS